MEYYSTIKKNEIMSLTAAWMDLQIVILSEVSQTEGAILYDIPDIWNLKRNDAFFLFGSFCCFSRFIAE